MIGKNGHEKFKFKMAANLKMKRFESQLRGEKGKQQNV